MTTLYTDHVTPESSSIRVTRRGRGGEELGIAGLTRLGANEGPCPRHNAYVIAPRSANTSKSEAVLRSHRHATVQSSRQQRAADSYCKKCIT
jgi:hypothetical protein